MLPESTESESCWLVLLSNRNQILFIKEKTAHDFILHPCSVLYMYVNFKVIILLCSIKYRNGDTGNGATMLLYRGPF